MATSILERAGRRIGPAGTADAARGRRLLDWLGMAALVTVNAVLVAVVLAAFFMADVGADWNVYREAGRRVADATVYQSEWYYVFRYSPLLAYAFAVIGPLGYVAWAGAHFAALLALPRRLALIVALSFPFWADVYNGNTLTFVVVAGMLALRGSRWATVAFAVMAVLMPRPLMIPLLLWLLWNRPAERVQMIVAGSVTLAASLVAPMGLDWALSLRQTGQEFGSRIDIGPSLLLGAWWVPIGFVLAAVLTWKGRVGLASLAISPYWLPYYPLVALLEITRPHGSSRR